MARLVARLIDESLLLMVFGFLMLLVAMPAALMTGQTSFTVTGLGMMAAVRLLSYGVLHTHLLSTRGQTIGKWLLGIQIVDMSGRKTELGRYYLREMVFCFVFVVAEGLGLGFLGFVSVLIIFVQSRMLHDYASATKVANFSA